jgi:hypothetical protein
MHLHFVSAPGGSVFMHELLAGVAHEVEQCIDGTDITAVHVSEGSLVGADDDVFVVVPHEYFRVLPPELLPDADVRQRTIGFCVEHPGTDTFDTTLAYARDLATCVDINDDSARALRSSGVHVERFHIGYTAAWDAWGGADTPRSRDMLYLGTSDDRRSRHLSADADTLAEYEVFMAMPPHEPMTKPRPDFFMEAEKHRLLAGSKVLLNLHRAAARSFEWVRVLEAASNGCVLVSEHSSDHLPFVAGRHFVAGSPHTLNHLARALLEHPKQLAELRQAAYDFVRTELPMKPAARMLAELAAGLGQPGASTMSPLPPVERFRRWPTWPNEPGRGDHSPPVDEAPPSVAVVDCLPAPANARGTGSVDIVVIPIPGAVPDPTQLAELRGALLEVGDPASSVLYVATGTAGSAANEALGSSTAEFVLVVDSTDRLHPGAVARLLGRIREDDADVAYGFVATPSGTFRSALPFEPGRMLRHDLLATAALWKRTTLYELGGWDPALPAGPLTWDLWRRLAQHAGAAAALVARPLVQQRAAQHIPPGTPA